MTKLWRQVNTARASATDTSPMSASRGLPIWPGPVGRSMEVLWTYRRDPPGGYNES